MVTGEKIVTNSNRPTIFVTAKRAKITVSTKAVGNQIEVTKTGDLSAPAIIPKLPKRKTLLELLQAATSAQRLKLFEHFELCCGNNRGNCICEAEILEPTQTPVDTRKDVLNALQAKIDGIQSGSIRSVQTIDDIWIEMPTTIENGETLYWHRKIKGAPVCYKREVNWDNFAWTIEKPSG